MQCKYEIEENKYIFEMLMRNLYFPIKEEVPHITKYETINYMFKSTLCFKFEQLTSEAE